VRRFRWSLQRLLDVTRQKELAQRAELLRTSREMAGTHQEIAAQKEVIRAALKELSAQGLETRIPRQEVVLACSAQRERVIEQLQERLRRLRARRKEGIAQLVKTKGSRETLERMREDARRDHLMQQLRLEQKELDEGSHILSARKLHRDGISTGPTGD